MIHGLIVEDTIHYYYKYTVHNVHNDRSCHIKVKKKLHNDALRSWNQPVQNQWNYYQNSWQFIFLRLTCQSIDSRCVFMVKILAIRWEGGFWWHYSKHHLFRTRQVTQEIIRHKHLSSFLPTFFHPHFIASQPTTDQPAVGLLWALQPFTADFLLRGTQGVRQRRLGSNGLLLRRGDASFRHHCSV